MLKTEKFTIHRLTALWAFSEAALGGILHALHLPFSGIFLGGFAVIFISLIFRYSENKSDVLKSLVIVLAVKFAVSPHTPIGAYFSVTVQGIFGYLIFRYIKNYFSAAFLFSLFVMIFSASQKIIVYSILFGFELINTLNLFIEVATSQIPFFENLSKDINYSLIIIGIYLSIYFIAGILLGLINSRLPFWLDSEAKNSNNFTPVYNNNFEESNSEFFDNTKKKKKKKRITTILILISIFLLIISYLFPEYEKIRTGKLTFMILRSLLILFIWYLFLLPFFAKQLRKFLTKSKTKYSSDIDDIIRLFPSMKKLLFESWQRGKGKNVLFRIKHFLVYFILIFLTQE